MVFDRAPSRPSSTGGRRWEHRRSPTPCAPTTSAPYSLSTSFCSCVCVCVCVSVCLRDYHVVRQRARQADAGAGAPGRVGCAAREGSRQASTGVEAELPPLAESASSSRGDPPALERRPSRRPLEQTQYGAASGRHLRTARSRSPLRDPGVAFRVIVGHGRSSLDRPRQRQRSPLWDAEAR